jgi:predicted dehydrogenase
MSQGNSGHNRRQFIQGAATTAAAVGGLSILSASAARGAEANSKIELGLIGCGGRGNFIADLVAKDGGGTIVAVADYFQDRADALGEKHKVDPARRYTGLDGYLKLLESKVDGVLIESPPYFHPEQAVAALQRGKHVYLAKPISVDVPGSLAIVAAAERVNDRLCCWVDFQTRMDPYYQGAFEQLCAGIIGKPYLGESRYHSGRLGIKCKPGTETARLRNWVFDKALSGDIIVEQNIHTLDVANWYLRGRPLKASGGGGRKVRTDVGDCYDYFACTFWYPDDVIVDFCSRQAGFGADGILFKLFCETGVADTTYAGQVSIKGMKANYSGGRSMDLYRTGAAANIRKYLEAIAAGKPVNNAQQAADSTMTAILGRTAAYRQAVVTWDEMVKECAKVDAKLELPADGPRLTA